MLLLGLVIVFLFCFCFPLVCLLGTWIRVLIFGISHSIHHNVKQMGCWMKEFPWIFLTECMPCLWIQTCSTGSWQAAVGLGTPVLGAAFSVCFLLPEVLSLCGFSRPPQSRSSWPGSDKKFSISVIYSSFGKGTSRALAGLGVHWVSQQCLHFPFAFFLQLKIFDYFHHARHWATKLNALHNSVLFTVILERQLRLHPFYRSGNCSPVSQGHMVNK